MKIILQLLFTTMILTVFVQASEARGKHKKLPLEIALPYLEGIEGSAINLGSGPVDIHVFVDPKCPRSREFISLISENKKMQKMYSYHIYLYELKRFHSKSLIESIYSSKNRMKALLDVMVKDKTLPKAAQSKKVTQKILSLKKVGEKLDVYKRPYLILVRKGKH